MGKIVPLIGQLQWHNMKIPILMHLMAKLEKHSSPGNTFKLKTKNLRFSDTLSRNPNLWDFGTFNWSFTVERHENLEFGGLSSFRPFTLEK